MAHDSTDTGLHSFSRLDIYEQFARFYKKLCVVCERDNPPGKENALILRYVVEYSIARIRNNHLITRTVIYDICPVNSRILGDSSVRPLTAITDQSGAVAKGRSYVPSRGARFMV